MFALLVTSLDYIILFGSRSQDVETKQSQGHVTNSAVFPVEDFWVVTLKGILLLLTTQ